MCDLNHSCELQIIIKIVTPDKNDPVNKFKEDITMKKMIAAFVACVVVFGSITACAKKNDEAQAKAIADSIRNAFVTDSIAAAAAVPAVDTTAVVVDSAAAAAAPATK